jgi:hypothetical protein
MKNKPVKGEQSRYSAMLLFQFRVVVGGRSSTMRTCEKRLIVFYADSAKAALAWAKRRGKASKYSYKNGEGNPVHFEFVGVLDLLNIGVECEEDEVWYDIISLKTPMERAKNILPPNHKLTAMRGRAQIRRSI